MPSSIESDVDGSSSEEDVMSDVRVMHLMILNQTNICLTTSLLSNYFFTYFDKNEPRTSQLLGFGWVMETLVTSGESHMMFRMDASLFYRLHDILVNEYGLTSSMHMSSMELLAIFLSTC
jgi:hypothetical protein